MSEAKSPHGEQSIPFEWGVATVGDERFVVRDVPEGMAELYRIIRESANPRAMLKADAVIYNGRVVVPEYQDQYKSVQFYHDYAGRMDRVPVDEPVGDPAFLLRKIHVAKHILDFPETNKR